MSIRPTDRWAAPSRGTPQRAISYAERVGAKRLPDVRTYLIEMHRLCLTYGLDYALLVSHSAVETGDPERGRGWLSDAWEEWLNAVGLGITDGGLDIQPYRDGIEAARAHVVHLLAYLSRDDAMPSDVRAFVEAHKHLDPRFDDIPAAWRGSVRTLADLQGKWWTNPTGTAAIVARGNAIFPALPDQAQEQEMTNPSILVVAGHRSTDRSGNAEETSLTPALARDYRRVLRDAGYPCWWLQEEVDGDWDPDDTAGDLDTVGQQTALWMTRTPGPLILLDLHYEGSPARGAFGIIPDKDGLGTAIPVVQVPDDLWELNTLDRRVAAAWVKQMTLHTGLPARVGIREPGLMDEDQTGVGQRFGARLAMFAYTSPHRDHAVRLVLEHGNHTHAADRELIFRDDFTQRCAAAVVAALDEVYGVAAEPEPAPEPEPEPEPDPPAEEPTLLPLPEGMSWELVARHFDQWVMSWNGQVVRFDPDRAYAQVWFNRCVRSIPAGKPYWYGSWPSIEKAIRRSGKRLEYKWQDGSSYLSSPNQPEWDDAEEAA